MKIGGLLCLLLSLQAIAQDGQLLKPKLEVSVVVPNPVPTGTCTQKDSEFGYLERSKGDNHWVPYTPSELGTWIADRLSKGFVVTVYPQPEGRLWVYAVCGKPAN